MAPTNPSPDRTWVQRLIGEERAAAAALLAAGILGLAVAARLGADGTERLLHPFLLGQRLDLPWLAADGLLTVFFLVAGLELRHELTSGSLTDRRSAAVPTLAAVCGMALPALLFLWLAPADARGAWGVPMATDLPLALALLAVLGRRLPLELRAFLLTLAIVDDVLSILVIAIAFGASIAVPWLLVVAALVATYALVQRGWPHLAWLPALLAWLAMLQTGIHPTVLGVLLGLLTRNRTDQVRDRLQPVAGFVAVPCFVFTSLALPLTTSDIDVRLVGALAGARVLGKAIGIGGGALLAVALFRPRSSLPGPAYFVAGAVASLGFSVSLLFAELALPAGLLVEMKAAVIATLGISALVGAVALAWLGRSIGKR